MSGRMHGTTGAVFAGHMVTFSVPCVIGDLARPGASPKIPFVKLTRHSALALLDKPSAAPHPRAMADAPSETRVELIVVGGGLVGLTLAIACAEAGIEVAVIDREDPATMLAEPFDGRTTAIAHGSQQVLAGIGLWPLVAAEAEPILEIRVADGGSSLFLHYDHHPVGDHPLRYIVQNPLLRPATLTPAAQLRTLPPLAPPPVQPGRPAAW